MEHDLSPTRSTAQRLAFMSYGLVCYAVFLGTILYAIGFIGNFWPALGFTDPLLRNMDIAPAGDASAAIWIDLGVLALFALQHSGMARPAFKRRMQAYVPEALERSTYVLLASVCLDLLFWQWRPLGTTELWHVDGRAALLVAAVSVAGWALVFASTFMIDHFDLFGLRQTYYAFRGRAYPGIEFTTPGLYRAVRHPIYLGFIIAFWATPVLTVGHAVFAAGTTLYILGAIQLEERDLVQRYGEAYDSYRRKVRMLLPLYWPGRQRPSVAERRARVLEENPSNR